MPIRIWLLLLVVIRMDTRRTSLIMRLTYAAKRWKGDTISVICWVSVTISTGIHRQGRNKVNCIPVCVCDLRAGMLLWDKVEVVMVLVR